MADEPVSALDVSIQAQVINLLEDLQKTRRHDPRTSRPARPAMLRCEQVTIGLKRDML